ncbi:alpha-ketoglutarate-dependent dioxygenase AlkB family protein [Croceiramulus getboli]|nr:alpha-ketoglutarate-dependent dioxygenase AlkB [Flavobacteriaceae bacterium YJPT1-3]
MAPSLFDSPWIHFPLAEAEVSYLPGFLSAEEADRYFKSLRRTVDWQQDDITVFGKTYAQPRLTALYAQNSLPYRYSNLTLYPKPFTADLIRLKARIELETPHTFTTCLCNLYRNGQDSNGWHSDDEKELGMQPVIASVSLGAERRFHLKHKTRKEERLSLVLEHGSLLIMAGNTQHFWKHQLPKTKKPVGERINLTFRKIA